MFEQGLISILSWQIEHDTVAIYCQMGNNTNFEILCYMIVEYGVYLL